jgi:predicted aconitase
VTNVLAPTVDLSPEEQAMLAGDDGEAVALAMRILLVAGRTQSAERLIPIASAHVDSCLYHGQSSQDFVDRLLQGDGRVRVPTTLNVGGLDLNRPDLFVGNPTVRDGATRLMESYVELGCQATFTCAPYQLPGRPGLGVDVAWAESNAIVFGNSMIGLRTNRYGDLIDVCAAITGRVPYSGLHLTANRSARAVFTVDPDALTIDSELLPALLGVHVGRLTGTLIPVIDGLQSVPVDDDWGKSLGAASASGGGVAMFHIAGWTPEAPDLLTATQGEKPLLEVTVTRNDLLGIYAELTSAATGIRLGGVSIGTPHLSQPQLVELARLLDGRQVRVPTYATTSRAVVAAEPGAVDLLEACGVTIVRDTCTYGPSQVLETDGAMMTNSSKWAYYAPSQLGYKVVLASRRDCVESAVSGEVLVGAVHG